MKLKVAILVGLTAGVVQGQAQEILAEIKSVNASKSTVLVESAELRSMEAGDILNLGSNCALQITTHNGSQAVASTDLCEDKNALKRGSVRLQTSAERPDLETAAPVARPSSRQRFASLTSGGTGLVAEGFRVEFIKSFLDGTVTGDGVSIGGDVTNEFGLGAGYAYIPVQAIGGIGRLVYTRASDKSASMRLDASATYGLTDQVYLLGGLNANKFVQGGTGLDLGIGFQVGAGFQVTDNFGLGVSYLTMNNSGQGVKFSQNGLELSVHGTF